jgi:hypothetical protein
MVFDIDLSDIQQEQIPHATQDVLNDEFLFIMERINNGHIDTDQKWSKSVRKEIESKGADNLVKWLADGSPKAQEIKEQIKATVIKNVSKMANKYEIHWDYEEQSLSKKDQQLLNKVVKHIKQVTRHKTFKVSSVYIYGELGVYIAKSCFNKAQIGIDMEAIKEFVEENPGKDLESEIYTTILHELKHADQDLENRLEVDNQDLEDEAEDYGKYVYYLILQGKDNITL